MLLIEMRDEECGHPREILLDDGTCMTCPFYSKADVHNDCCVSDQCTDI